ncbi:MAG: M23 family metallopeptidase [Deltaproteobacteria bacterium]|nr:M23 family metallopeptidase [Deltaproteobacteria bacterium]
MIALCAALLAASPAPAPATGPASAPTAIMAPVDAGAMAAVDGGADAASGTATSASGATLTINTEAAVPGGILVLDVRNYKWPEALRGKLLGEKLKFFTAGKKHQRALVGISLEQEPGPLKVEVELHRGKTVETLSTTIAIASKEFRKSELKVASKFVTPPKSEKEHIAQDKVEINKAYKSLGFGPATFVGKLSQPRDSEITAHFGDQRLYNGKKKNAHQGTDFDGKIGDPIQAAADGVVILARGCYYSGNTVIVAHGGGLFTSYFHMSRMDVTPGQQVTRGTQLGLVGKTGRVTGPHLHLGVKIHDRLVDAEEAFKLDLGLDKGQTPEFPHLAIDVADGGASDAGPEEHSEVDPLPASAGDAGAR